MQEGGRGFFMGLDMFWVFFCGFFGSKYGLVLSPLKPDLPGDPIKFHQQMQISFLLLATKNNVNYAISIFFVKNVTIILDVKIDKI